jgi:hypothetical protein
MPQRVLAYVTVFDGLDGLLGGVLTGVSCAGDPAAGCRIDVGSGVADSHIARGNRRIVGAPGRQGCPKLVGDLGVFKLLAVAQVAFEVVDHLHRLLAHLEAQPGVDLRRRSREVPEVARRALGWLEHKGVVPLDFLVNLNNLPVGRAKLRVPNVGVKGRILEVNLVLQQRECARAVDDDRGVVLDRVALVFANDAGDRPVVSLFNIVDDGVVVEFRAGLLRAFDQQPTIFQAVDNGKLAGHRDLKNGVVARDLEAAVIDIRVRERGLDLRFRDRSRELVGSLQRVATGDMAGLLGVLSLDDNGIKARVGDRRRGITARRARADNGNVVLVRGHWFN